MYKQKVYFHRNKACLMIAAGRETQSYSDLIMHPL